MKVSRQEGSAPGKSKAVCSDQAAEEALGPHLRDLRIPLVQSLRWLGVDYQPAAPRAKPTRQGRFKTARHKNPNVEEKYQEVAAWLNN